MLISIIVPVYNVEKYLRRCIESLIDHSLNYEILLINDGSTDNSHLICEEYCNRYSFIRLINQKNKGLAGARNTGIKHAKGKYLMFIDSDDFIDKGSLKVLYKFIEVNGLDVGLFDFRYVNDKMISKKNKYTPYKCNGVVDGTFYLKKALELNLPMMVWKNIYRTDFVKNNDLLFLEGYNHEDEYWSLMVLLNAKKVMSKNFIFYNYFINEYGISKNSHNVEKNCLDLMKLCIIIKSLINKMNIYDEELIELLHKRIITLYLSSFYRGKMYTKKYKEELDINFFDDLVIKERSLLLKVKLFKFSEHLYYIFNKILKEVKKFEKIS